MKRTIRRTPKGYDGLEPPGRQAGSLGDQILSKIASNLDNQTENISNVFLSLLNEPIRPYVKPVSFSNGKLFVKVQNPTLLSILSSQEKGRLLHNLKGKLPAVEIQDIVFQIG